MSLFEELKRRNVFRVAVAYLITAWVLLQVADVVLQNIHAPDWVIQAFMLALALGFPVAVIFAWAFEMTPEGIKKEKDIDRTQSITQRTGRKLDFAIIGVLAVAVVFLLADRFGEKASERVEKGPDTISQQGMATPGSTEDKMNPAPVKSSSSFAPQAKSVAVLPFVNMSSDPEQEYFSDGISEEILNALAKVKGLKVAGRTSSFAFKGHNEDLRKIGEALGVGNILEGSVRKSGKTVRITAQLIQVADGFHLWSETYDRELNDVFAIQDEITNAILEQLKATLVGKNATVVAAERTDSKAYDRYLLAKQRMYDRKETSLQSALALLDEAIELDPEYAPAYAQRAVTTLLMNDENYGSIPKAESLEQAKLYIDKALLLNPDLAEAHAALGLYYLNQPGEAQRAADDLQKALDLNPNLVDAANWLSMADFNLGKAEEAIKVFQRINELDPFYRPGISATVSYNNSKGKTADSWAYLERISPFFPDDPWLAGLKADTYLTEGHAADALSLYESALQREPGRKSYREGLGSALIFSGQYERAVEVSVPGVQAWALALLGRAEEASIITTKIAASGEDVSSHVRFTVMAGKNSEAIDFFETRWPDFESFERDFPLTGFANFLPYADLAQAYLAVGNEGRFQQTMARFRAQLDALEKIGLDFYYMNFMEAVYFTLAGDHESALANLQLAVDKGYLGYPRISTEWVQFKPLEGDPQYEAIQARMVEHLNAERTKLNLGPMTI